MVTLKLLLAISAIKQWHTLQLDVNNAFLNKDLNEEVYMDLPQGLNTNTFSDHAGPQLPCKLHKLIYGLRQSSRQWYIKFSQELQQTGFTQSQDDYVLFTQGLGTDFITLLVYVDDIVLGGPNLHCLQQLQDTLNTSFKLKTLGTLKYFLGFEIARSSKGTFLSQHQYTLQLLEDTGYLGSKPVATPMDPKIKLNTSDGEPLLDPSQYRRLVARLLYLTLSRPDITLSVHFLSQFLANPKTPHLQAAHHLLRYLKVKPDQGLLYPTSSSLHLRAFSNSDWASCPTTRRSTTGICVFLGDCLISWRSKKQPTISRSSTEAEYHALAATASELTWIQYLLADFHLHQQSPSFIYCDNKSAIHIANNPTFS
ncbi:uncharacterized mitochondrial protein AtMg00810-like [Humulus lupulus]|uniref:uncharacterized mitochondrial protein AtMg00810-like n=1 Tax=Humulus lupulus TaxID=3486 RepID=UPI002B40174F|nr:uncharacterized mitochondrial protein AtMg00810-like [Humulus lupulus]